ncbi:MAG: acyltransferase [Isosphaeraceae bacterium]
MRRIPELDGLRGLAALTVVMFHLYITAVPFGWAAVDLFFVLSGFLITGIVIEQMERPGFLKTFYARRSLRIWPIYYLTIVVLLVATAVSWRVWLPFALYLQNTGFYLLPWDELRGKVFGPDWPTLNHTWSLAVEEQFYLVWPALLLLAGRSRVPLLAGLGLAVSVAARSAGYPHTLLLSRCDGLALGALLASILSDPAIESAEDRKAAVRPWIRVSLGLVLLLAMRLGHEWRTGRVRLPLGFRMEDAAAEVLTVSLLAFALVAWVVVDSGHRRFAWLRWRPPGALGTISYGLYLYHVPVLHSVDAILPRSIVGFRALEGLLTLGLTLAVAGLSWRYIEQPILRLKDRFDYLRPERVTAEAAAPPPLAISLAGE